MQGVTTNCYEPEELQSLCSDSDEEEDLLEPIVQEDEGRQVVDEQQQSNGQGEINNDSRGDDENPERVEERPLVDEPEPHVDSEPNNPEEDIIDLTGDSDDEQVVDDRLVESLQELDVSNPSVQRNTADQVASDGRQTAGNESHLGNSYARYFFF